LTELNDLSLNDNQFTGSITGSIPVELNNLRKLEVLWINNNQFTGAFEIDISNLPLMDFCYDNNMFTGDLPSKRETDYYC
jgi:Leucine-rich repeat (LRR) protein